jgi:hypothetical protein
VDLGPEARLEALENLLAAAMPGRRIDHEERFHGGPRGTYNIERRK